MKKVNLKELRSTLMINFIAEILFIINVYLSNIHTIKVLKINVLLTISIILNIVAILFVLKLVKNQKKEKNIIIVSLLLEVLVILLNFLSISKIITILLQLLIDILKFIVMIFIYKSIKNRNRNIIFTLGITYLMTRVCYLLVIILKGITIKPIISTIYIIGIVAVYGIFIKSLEKNKR